MANCVNCGRAIYDELWGDYKCSAYGHHVYDYEPVECEKYEEGNPKESKTNADYEANLRDC